MSIGKLTSSKGRSFRVADRHPLISAAASARTHVARFGLWPTPGLLIDQYCLLPSAWRLVGAVNAARPAAGPLLPLQPFFTGPLDAALAGRRLFRVIDPADEFIPAERRQAFPQRKDFGIGSNGRLQVVACLVDSAMGERVCHETSKHCRPTTAFFSAAWKRGFESDRCIMECPRLRRLAALCTRIAAPLALPSWTIHMEGQSFQYVCAASNLASVASW